MGVWPALVIALGVERSHVTGFIRARGYNAVMIALRHLYSVIGYPLVVTLFVPLTIFFFARERDTRLDLHNENVIFPIIAGIACLVLGFMTMLASTQALSDVGDIDNEYETWDPTKYLVIVGPYARVRNPLTLA